jgi:hypothetical protein
VAISLSFYRITYSPPPPLGALTDLLPEAVWALNTTEYRATGFTPFRLLYGSEAMTP